MKLFKLSAKIFKKYNKFFKISGRTFFIFIYNSGRYDFISIGKPLKVSPLSVVVQDSVKSKECLKKECLYL